jgi:UDP:flavonoid glycosyltransferase YjiC (YdhE family)
VNFGTRLDRRTHEDASIPRHSSTRGHALIVSWASGGNLPPLLTAGRLLAARDHAVSVLASAATREAAVRAGFEVIGYRRAPAPNTELAFEQQAAELMATAAGTEVALDVRDVVADVQPDLMIVDCMLPAGIAVGEAMGTPTASLVHFPYGLARAQMLRGAGAWTTDLTQLNITRRSLGLKPAANGLAAWESPELLLVTVPRWFDLTADYPAKVIHAGPLGISRLFHVGTTRRRSLVLLSFSTTVMEGQTALVQRVCDAVAGDELDAILTLGPALSAAEIRVPHNVEVVQYADHDQLLPTCVAVVTHGGLGTTLRALGHGKPLLLLPLGRDQEFNAGRVVELGAGIHAPAEATAAEIASALAELLAQPQFTKAAERAAAAIAADAPDETATEALLSLAQLAM